MLDCAHFDIEHDLVVAFFGPVGNNWLCLLETFVNEFLSSVGFAFFNNLRQFSFSLLQTSLILSIIVAVRGFLGHFVISVIMIMDSGRGSCPFLIVLLGIFIFLRIFVLLGIFGFLRF